MGSLYNLIIGDQSATLVDPQGRAHTLQPYYLGGAKKIKVNLILNNSELDISCVKIPKMSFLDRQKFRQTRKQYKATPLLYGSYLHKNVLVESTSPQYEILSDWIKELIKKGHEVASIKPFILSPQAKDQQFSLVLSDHGKDGLRQTVFEGQVPIFTRITQSTYEDILATLTYVKNHYSVQQINVEGALEDHLIHQLKSSQDPQVSFGLLEKVKGEGMYIQQLIPSLKIDLPLELKMQKKEKFYNQSAILSYGLSFLLIGFAGWQLIVSQLLFQHEQKLSQAIEAQASYLAIPSSENLVPSAYKKLSRGPLPVFSILAQHLPEQAKIINIKWQNREAKEICEFELLLVQETIEVKQAVQKIEEFKTSLDRSLKGYKVEVTSMPYQSGEHETFSGTASLKKLQFSGKAQSAQIKLTRQK